MTAAPVIVHEDIGVRAIVSSAIFASIAGLSLAARLYTRTRIVKFIGLDDWVVCSSWLASVLLTVCIGLEVKYGLGEHIQFVSAQRFLNLGKVFYVSILVYSYSLTAVKASILLQYIRVFASTSVRIVSYVILAALIGRGIGALFGTIFACHPISFFWNKAIEGGTCIDLTALWYCNASIDIATDVALMVLPMPIIFKLNMPKKQKIIVFIILMLGGFGCVTSILRLHSLRVVLSTTDLSYNNTGAAMWSSIEINTAMICANLATLKPFVSHCFPRFFQHTMGGTVDTATATRERAQSYATTTFVSSHLPSISETVNSGYTAHRKKSSLTTSAIIATPIAEGDECLYHSFMMDMVDEERPVEKIESEV